MLYVGAVYYVIGAVAHFFALTIFPWFDGALYAPYQDTVIAFVALVLAYFLIVAARNPVKNSDLVNAIIVSATAASIVSIAIIWKVNFAALGAPGKELQTITEGILGLFWVGALLAFRPRHNN